MPRSPTIHATAVLFAGTGLLIRGASGSGKSRLAHALMMRHSARLIADDRVALRAEGGVLLASAPAPLAGLLEVRGLGIVRFPHLAEAPLGLALDLVPEGDIPRMPDSDQARIRLMGVTLPRAFAASPETALDILLTISGQSGARVEGETPLAYVRFDGKTECP